jgi:hypothetical protein
MRWSTGVAVAAVIATCSCASLWSFDELKPGDAGADAASGDDSGSCVAVSFASPPLHGGAACPSGPTCFPHAVTTFAGNWVPPVGAHQNQCTNAQIAGFITNCGASTPQQCNAWAQANAPCYGCLFTPDTAPQYGAVIGYGNVQEVNLGGCIVLAEPCNEACAQAVLNDFQCVYTACDPHPGAACGVTDSTSSKANAACVQAADSTCGCSGYASSARCATQLTGAQHPAETLCNLLATDFNTSYTAVATFMCGP